jgi:His-Xaa-Ser system protein HxsD
MRFSDGALQLALSSEIYSVDAILRTCYWLTDRCYVHLSKTTDSQVLTTLIAKGGQEMETNAVAWQFLNELLDNQLRVSLQRETASIREMIVAQAFSDVDVIDDHGRPVSPGRAPDVDEKSITSWRPVR